MEGTSNDMEKFITRCWDKFNLMPEHSKNELLAKVFLIAVGAGILSAVSIVLLPISPVIGIAAGAGAFLYYADQYTPQNYIRDVINNPGQAINRAINDPGYRQSAFRRMRDSIFSPNTTTTTTPKPQAEPARPNTQTRTISTGRQAIASTNNQANPSRTVNATRTPEQTQGFFSRFFSRNTTTVQTTTKTVTVR